ncbi:hypothetical protein [Pedobacter nutrimenti]|uniref:hypothetical protein n=1 Tax=Pedobacter nutrimenti TaxID=1241337 RepID=UPI00292D93A8|nr:hypothetical protein [Pedobacter nutrimenti]
MGIIETEKMLNIEEGKTIGKIEGIEIGKAKGIEIGKSQVKEHFVTNLIATFGFSNEQAAKAVDAPISFVRKIRRQLEKSIN